MANPLRFAALAGQGWGRTTSAEARRRSLRRAEHAEQVLTRELPQVLVAPPPADELRKQLGEPGYVFQTTGDLGDPIEVAAEPDVVRAGHPPDVLDMVGDLLQGRRGRRMLPLPLGEPGRALGRIGDGVGQLPLPLPPCGIPQRSIGRDDIRIVVIGGNRDEEQVVSRVGANSFLYRPVDLDSLVQSVV